MPSGAGHDAQSLGPIAPIGMIFVPSSKGVSHAPDEYHERAADHERSKRAARDCRGDGRNAALGTPGSYFSARAQGSLLAALS